MSKFVAAALLKLRDVLQDHWPLFVAFLMIVGGVIDIALQFSPLAVILGAVSIALLGYDVVRTWLQGRGWTFGPANVPMARIKAALAGNKRFRLMRADNGSIVIDTLLTADIGSGYTEARLGAPYVLPREFRIPGRIYRKRNTRGPYAFNGKSLGMNSNVGIGTDRTSLLTTTPADHWRYVGSDLYATKAAKQHGNRVDHTGSELYTDRRGNLRDYGTSLLLNAIGTSVLAITSDGYLVLCEQTKLSLGSPLLLAPAGSGTLEPKDFRGANQTKARDLVLNGAIREMEEETGILESFVIGPRYVLGFGRWLEKGAKPESIGLVFLDITHDVIALKPPKPDKPYTLRVLNVEFRNTVDKWRPTDLRTMVASDIQDSMSVPLAIGLILLAETARTNTELHAELAGRVRAAG